MYKINKNIFLKTIFFILLILGTKNANARLSWSEFSSLSPSQKQSYNSTIASGGDATIASTSNGQSVFVVGNSASQTSAWAAKTSTTSNFSSLSNALVTGAIAHGANPIITATSASCDNGAGVSLILPYSYSPPVISYTPKVSPTPPSPPSPPSCSYISGWTPTWSVCNISSNWNNKNQINCVQAGTFNPVSSKLGKRTCPLDANLPNNTKEVTLTLNYISNDCPDVYANGTDECSLKFNLSGVPPEGISGFDGLETKNISFNGGYLDQTIKIGEKGTIFNSSELFNNNLYIKLSSLVPFSKEGELEFDIMGKDDFERLSFENVDLSLKKPFSGTFKVSNNNGDSWDSMPEIGTDQKYKIELSNNGMFYSFTNGNLSISEDSVKNTIVGHSFENFGNTNNYFGSDSTDYLGFTARINATDNILKKPLISSNNLKISYSLGGKFIQYYLTQNTNGGDNTEFTIGVDGENNTLGLKVVGTLQGDGKSEITGQEENFSDLYKTELRNLIRKNAYSLSKNMTSGQILNGVKYVIGDYNLIGDNLGYETLIIKDGNLTISGNVNNVGDKLGIIILKDSYNTTSDYNNKGNIYINKEVSYINAIMYADGGIISSNSGVPYITDSSTRTSDLQNQLIIKGTTFTRNTIGGAILAGGNYLLPGGQTTDSFDNAMIYDLNYLRRGNIGNNGEYLDYTIIEYNPAILTDPPIGFSK